MQAAEQPKRRRLAHVVWIALVLGLVGAWAAALPESQVETLPWTGSLDA